MASIYNINKGRNAEIASKSPVLSGYNELIAEVNKNRQTMELAEAKEKLIKGYTLADIENHLRKQTRPAH